ncbi:MAG: TldD/PmbA family protein [Bacillota bacterium]
MRVPMSDYLSGQKEAIRQLVVELSHRYPYVSVLGTDLRGKHYLVQKNATQVSDSRWVERGFVVRVHNGRYFSEYSFNQMDADGLADLAAAIDAGVNRRLEQARSAGTVGAEYPVLQEEELQRSFYGEAEVLPETVNTAAKLTRMAAMKDQALKESPLLVDFRVSYEEISLSKVFMSARKELEQAYVWSQGYLIPIVRRENKTKLAYRTFSGLKGPELLDEMSGAVTDAIWRAERLLDAEPVEPGEYEVICSPEIAGLIAHEAFGHGVEMDMFVKKRAKAAEYLGKPIAAELVTMHDGAAAAKQVSSYLFDDEGVLGTDTRVIDRGVLQCGISDQLSAIRLGVKPTGNGKRESFERKAYSRMTNTFFAPGSDSLETMIASIRHGYLLDGTMSGMEDPKNWGIQCLILQGEEIRDGKLTGKLISPVIMTGYVPDVLQAVSMVAPEVRLFGSGACGKGHKELVKVSDGGPYIKTRVRLG